MKNEFSRTIFLPEPWQVKCPLYQARLRMFMQEHDMPRQDRKDWLTDIYRDRADGVLFVRNPPHWDQIFKDDSGKSFENFINGAVSRVPEFVTWGSAAMMLIRPEMTLFTQEHERQSQWLH